MEVKKKKIERKKTKNKKKKNYSKFPSLLVFNFYALITFGKVYLSISNSFDPRFSLQHLILQSNNFPFDFQYKRRKTFEKLKSAVDFGFF